MSTSAARPRRVRAARGRRAALKGALLLSITGAAACSATDGDGLSDSTSSGGLAAAPTPSSGGSSGGTTGTGGTGTTGAAGEGAGASAGTGTGGATVDAAGGTAIGATAGTTVSDTGGTTTGGAAGTTPGGTGGTTTGGTGGTTTQLHPDQGTLLGAFVGTGPVAEAESMLGQKLAIHLSFFDWGGDLFGSAVSDDVTEGRIPLVAWEPWQDSVGIPLGDIIAGTHDALIRQRARDAMVVGAPVMLRWGHEMNGDWYPWGGPNNGASAGGPDTYIAAYRHIHDVFVEEGATQVVWVWSPNNASSPYADWNHFSNYYPGDDYVDWVGVSGYNWGSTQPWGWNSFESLFVEWYDWYAGSGKPLIVTEFASTEEGGDKAAWITDMAATTKTFPALKGLVWFHIDKETDWRINSSAASLNAFLAMANDPYFLP